MSDEYDNSYQQQQQADAQRAWNDQQASNQAFFQQQQQQAAWQQQQDAQNAQQYQQEQYAREGYAQSLQNEQDRIANDNAQREEIDYNLRRLNQSRAQNEGAPFDPSTLLGSNTSTNGQAYSDFPIAGQNDDGQGASSATGSWRGSVPRSWGSRRGELWWVTAIKALFRIFFLFIIVGGVFVYNLASTTPVNQLVFGIPGRMQINGHMHQVALVYSQSISDPGLPGTVRTWIDEQKSYELLTTTLIHGSIANIKLTCPGEIKVFGDVSDCTIIAPHGLVYVYGQVRGNSTIEAHDFVATGKVSPVTVVQH